MAETSILEEECENEKKCENVTPDGMAKEEEVASSNPILLPVESWDFGKYSCEDAEKKLMAIGINKGQFIVRDNRDPGTFSLSVRDNDPQKGDHVKHYRILEMVGGNGIFIFEGSIFRTLSELVHHYQMNSEGLCCSLTKACPQEEPNTIGLGKDRWKIHHEFLRMTRLEHGQFGEVWQGVWNGNTPVAVKTLKEGTSADFLAEADFMKRFRHERLLQPYAVCSDREPIYKLTSNGSLLDYLKDGTGKDTKLTTHVDRGAHITIAKKSNEKECDNVPPDDGGMVKERPIEAANENTNLLCPLKKEEELKETEKHAALGEQNTSLPPASNNKTCITKLAGIEPKYMWMLRLIIFVLLISGANGIKVEEGKYRKVIIATNETQTVTDPIEEGPNVGSVFAVVAEDGNDRKINFIADSDFVIENQSCYIEVRNKNQTECEGLQIFRNGTHIYLTVDGSKLPHYWTAFYIYQQVPHHFSLYFLDVYKNQDIDECASSPCVNGGTCVDGHDSYTCNCARGYDGADCEIDINECASNPCQNGGACVDELDSYTCNCAKGYDGANCEIGSNSTYWKNAFIGVAVVAVVAIIVILTLVYFLCCRKKSTKRVRDKSAKRVRDEDIEMGRLQSFIDPNRTNGHAVEC